MAVLFATEPPSEALRDDELSVTDPGDVSSLSGEEDEALFAAVPGPAPKVSKSKEKTKKKHKDKKAKG